MISDIISIGSKIIDSIFPDKNEADKQKVKLLELQQAGDFKQIEAEIADTNARADVIKAEASNNFKYVSYWRPTLAYSLIAMIVFHFILFPLLNGLFGLHIVIEDIPHFAIDTLSVAMAGYIPLRSWEKGKIGVAGKVIDKVKEYLKK